MAVEDWLALESLKNKINQLFPRINLKLKPPTKDHSLEFHLEGYRINIIESKLSHEMGELKYENHKNYLTAHKEIVTLYNSVINRNTNLSEIEKKWKFPCLYFITVTKKYENIEKNDKEIIKFLGEEIRDERLYSICSNDNTLIVEKLLYIGKTTDIVNRFRDGHKVTQVLSDSAYDRTEKKVYIAEVDIFNIFDFKKITGIQEFQDKFLEFTPLESIMKKELIDDIQTFIERYFISYFKVPIYNVKDKTPKVNFVKWPIVSQPNIITINNLVGSCFFYNLKLEDSFGIEELLDEPRKKYEKSKKRVKEMEEKFEEDI